MLHGMWICMANCSKSGVEKKGVELLFFSLKDCTKLVHSVSRKRMLSFNSYSYLMKQHVLSWIFDW